jgi:hypothetical protein
MKENDEINGNKEISFDSSKKRDHMDYDHDFSHGDHELQEIFPISLRFLFLYLLSSSRCSSLLISSDEPRCLRRMFQMWFTLLLIH